MTDKLYMCVGENFNFNCRIGTCGEIHTLQKWLEIVFPNKPLQETLDFFKYDTDKDVCDYIYKNRGKRLKRWDKRNDKL